MSQCDIATCGGAYRDNDCKCYPNMSIISSKNPTKEQLYGNQICAYESKDGFLYPCDSGCCQGGCPGQCLDVKPRPPQGTYKKIVFTKEQQNLKVFPLTYTLLIVMFLLAVASVASLWNGLKRCPPSKI